MANVTATARLGSRVIRVVGESNESQLSVAFQLDLALEHVRRNGRRLQPQPVVGVKPRVAIY